MFSVNPQLLPPDYCPVVSIAEARRRLTACGSPRLPAGACFYDPATQVAGFFVSRPGGFVHNAAAGKLVCVFEGVQHG